MTSKAKTVLIAGAGTYGYWNVGDEAILAAMINDLRELLPEVNVAVVSANPPGTLTRYGVQEIPWQDITQIINMARASDLLILGGGGLFYDYWGFDPGEILTKGHAGLGFYTGFALLATLLDKPLMIYAVGVGPLISEMGRSFTRLAFDQAHVATVRDAESKTLLEAIGVDVARVRVTADPAFDLRSADEEQSRRIIAAEHQRPAPRPLLGVALRSWDIGVFPAYWEGEVAAALDRFIEQYDGTALFIPLHLAVNESRTDDLAVADRVRSRMRNGEQTTILRGEYAPEEKAGVLQVCDLVLGMRLHSLIFAIQQGVPVVALPYDPKVANVLTRVDCQEYQLELGAITAEKLADLLAQAYEDRARLRGSLQTRLPELINLGRENARLAADLMERPARLAPAPQTLAQVKALAVKQSLRVHELWQAVEAWQAQHAALTEQQRLAQALSAQTAEREQTLSAQLAEREQTLSAQLAEREQTLSAQLAEREQTLSAQLAEREQTVQTLSAQVAEQEQLVQALNAQAAEKELALQALTAQAAEQEQVVQALSLQVAERDLTVKRLWTQITAITESRGWTLLQRLWRIRLWLIPHEGWRKRLALRGVQMARGAKPEVFPPPLKHEILPPLSKKAAEPLLPKREAQPDHGRRVPILVGTFFDFDGNNMFFGGAERYMIELARLVRELGYEPEVYQCARTPWVRYYADLRVTGIEAGTDMRRLNEQFHALVPEGALTIYLAFFLAAPKSHARSIGISHGIYWDQVGFQATPAQHQQYVEEILTCFANASAMVSVDTNTINWVRTARHNLAEKFTYIPNFVDLTQFRPAQHPAAQRDKRRLVILYPRRLYGPRGFWLAAALVPELVEKYPEVEFHFVGKADEREEEAVRELVARYPQHVRWYFLPPERMHEAYQAADITIIPTTNSEGTSLSCLEALASGNAVVATNVGGLPDLILPGHNGLLIEPQAEALQEALERLIQDEALRRRLGRRGRQVAQTFSVERWRAQWQRALEHFLPKPEVAVSNNGTRVAAFPAAPGISWEGLKQRPHHMARQLAGHGVETFWGNPDGRQPNPQEHLHIVAAEDDLYLKEPLLFIYYPYHFPKIKQFERPFVIYDVLDDISIHDRSDALMEVPAGARARDYHSRLLERADLVLTSARVLHERVKAQRPDALYVPNGVDLEHFAAGRVAPAAALSQFARPLIGYHGAIAEWFDHRLLLEVVRQRRQYQFVLIGPLAEPELLNELRPQPNVHYLGSLPYEQIPSYVAGFDVGILPFVLNPLTEGVRPLKVLEYLAMGKPAVATPLPELADWPGVLRAATAAEFAAQLDVALEQRSALAQDPQVRHFVATAAWPEVVRPLLRAIEERGVKSEG